VSVARGKLSRMCGRYVVTTPPQQLALDFEAVLRIEQEPVDYPDYNVAPTKPVPAVLVRGGERVLSTLRWGLVPFWAKDPSVGSKMINARIESAAEKSAFKQSFARRRCLLPADGYYEWLASPDTPAKGKPRKQPYYIRPAGDGPLAFAGLYERWRDAEGRELWSATILTGAAAEPMAWLHDRMPLTVPHADWEAWLDPAEQDPLRAHTLLDFAPRWSAEPVSDQVNSVRNNGPALVEPLSETVLTDPAQTGMAEPGALF
jgi:putative SOS response-associated peptidase YedK